MKILGIKMEVGEDISTNRQRMDFSLNNWSSSDSGFYGSYHPNLDDNIGATAWIIQCTDTDK